jgi:hypothetical protein
MVADHSGEVARKWDNFLPLLPYFDHMGWIKALACLKENRTSYIRLA